jgi:hypothetical protein
MGKKIETNGQVIKAKTLERVNVDVKTGLTEIREEDVVAYMKTGKERIERKFRRGEEPSAEVRPML